MELFMILRYVLNLEEEKKDFSVRELIGVYYMYKRWEQNGFPNYDFMRKCEEHKRVLMKLEKENYV